LEELVGDWTVKEENAPGAAEQSFTCSKEVGCKPRLLGGPEDEDSICCAFMTDN